MKNTIITLIVIIVLVALGWHFATRPSVDDEPSDDIDIVVNDDTATTTDDMDDANDSPESVIGQSANGNDIMAYTYGDGENEVVFVGGIHGGYSWNTALVAYELVDYLEANPSRVPNGVKVTVVPVLNPDGLEETTGSTGRFTEADVASDTVPGRFNGNGVDLNRNFDCDWQSEGVWQDQAVDGGTAAFSEPESAAIRDYILRNDPASVVVWYSAAGGVFASNCHDGVLAETRSIMNVFADASGYPAFEQFNFYEITGDMVNWLAGEGIPGISVLLSDHESVEWSMNRAGIDALLDYYEVEEEEVDTDE